MSPLGSASAPVHPGAEAALELPREPGVFRTFLRRHPLGTDVTVVVLALLITSMGLIISAPPDVMPAVEAPTAATIAVTVVRYVAAIALIVRRRWPLLPYVFGVTAHISALPVLTSTESVAIPVALYSTAVFVAVRTAWIALGCGTAAVVVVSALLALTGVVPWDIAISCVVTFAIGGLIGTLIGANVGGRRRYLDALIARSRQLMIERDQQAQLAAAAERTRIAREMHDIVSHNLTVIVALADGAVATDDRERARAVTEQIATSARGALGEMRSMLGVLRDPQAAPDAPLTPVDERSILDAVTAAQRAGFPVRLLSRGVDDAPARVRFAASRIVQEALTNAIRHAPNATFIDVDVETVPGETRVRIRNDGVRPHDVASSGGFGLRGLRERAVLLGGTMSTDIDSRGCWVVTAILPTPASAVETPRSAPS